MSASIAIYFVIIWRFFGRVLFADVWSREFIRGQHQAIDASSKSDIRTTLIVIRWTAWGRGRGRRRGACRVVWARAAAGWIITVSKILGFHTIGRRPNAGIRAVAVPRVDGFVARRRRGHRWSTICWCRFYGHSYDRKILLYWIKK